MTTCLGKSCSLGSLFVFFLFFFCFFFFVFFCERLSFCMCVCPSFPFGYEGGMLDAIVLIPHYWPFINCKKQVSLKLFFQISALACQYMPFFFNFPYSHSNKTKEPIFTTKTQLFNSAPPPPTPSRNVA